jgi:hypothetical protein
MFTAGFYIPHFYSKYTDKINDMTEAAFGYRKIYFPATTLTVFWGITLIPIIFTGVTMILMIAPPLAAFLSVDSNALFVSLNETFGRLFTFSNITSLQIVFFAGMAIWVVSSIIVSRCVLNVVNDVKEQTKNLAEYYVRDDILEKYEANYNAGLEKTEKMNWEAFNDLLIDHNTRFGYGNSRRF